VWLKFVTAFLLFTLLLLWLWSIPGPLSSGAKRVCVRAGEKKPQVPTLP
jgi:hypothetical protein